MFYMLKKIYPAYISKYNSMRYCLNDSKRRRTALSCSERITCIIKRNSIKNNNSFYCLNCFHLSRTKSKFESHKKLCENKDLCNIVMPAEDTKFHQYRKSPFIIYALYYKNNPEKLFTRKVSEHIPSGFSNVYNKQLSRERIWKIYAVPGTLFYKSFISQILEAYLEHCHIGALFQKQLMTFSF